MPGEIYIQNHLKILLKKLFTGVIQRFWLRVLDDLFRGVALFLLKSYFVKSRALKIKDKRFSKNSCSEVCDQTPQKIHANKFVFSMTRNLKRFIKDRSLQLLQRR